MPVVGFMSARPADENAGGSSMNRDFVSIRGLSLPRRMVLQGIASLVGGALAPGAFAAAAKSCRLTERDIIGPFYRFGAPFQTKLAGPAEPGERLIIAGKAYSADCRSRLPNTLIEVWQANKAGLYDTDKPGNFTERVDFRLRGMMLTDQ
jgi:catechol 1,2-dioxygenase